MLIRPFSKDHVMSVTHLNSPSPSQLIGELRKSLLSAPPPIRAEALTRIESLLERLKHRSLVLDQVASSPSARV